MRGSRHRWTSRVLALSLALGACGPRARVWRPDPDAAGPALRLIDSVVIAEPDSAQLGQYTSFFARAADGRLFIADATKHTVFQFAANGAFERLIGRSGQGPGELELPSSVVVLPGDTVVGVFDVNKRGLSLFSTLNGKYLRQVRFPAQDVGAPWGIAGDTAYVPLHMGQSLLGVWTMRDSTVTDHLPISVALASNPGLIMRHGRPGVAIADSGLALLLPTEPGVLITTRLGAPTGLVRIPAARRRGEPSNLAELERGKGRGAPPPPFAGSLAAGIHRLPSGDLLLVHLDLDLARAGSGPAQFVSPRLYVSILRRDLSAACVDGELRVESDVAPIPVFSGDTMFVLSRRVLGATVRSMVTSYVTDATTCRWIQTSRAPAEGD